MSLSNIEKEILAEGEKVAAAIKADQLKLRKSKLLEEVKTIEEALAKLLPLLESSAPALVEVSAVEKTKPALKAVETVEEAPKPSGKASDKKS